MTATVLPEVDLKSLPGVRQFDLTGQVAIITGGSKGLGAAIAAGLASAGATTVIVSRGLDEAIAVAKEITAGFGKPSIPISADCEYRQHAGSCRSGQSHALQCQQRSRRHDDSRTWS